MNLSSEEKQFYIAVYNTLSKSGKPIDEENCKRLISRGIQDQDVIDKIWNLTSNNKQLTTLTQNDLNKLLKYVAAYQNNHDIDQINIETIKGLPKANLPKKSEKDVQAAVSNSATKGQKKSSGSNDDMKTSDNKMMKSSLPPVFEQAANEAQILFKSNNEEETKLNSRNNNNSQVKPSPSEAKQGIDSRVAPSQNGLSNTDVEILGEIAVEDGFKFLQDSVQPEKKKSFDKKRNTKDEEPKAVEIKSNKLTNILPDPNEGFEIEIKGLKSSEKKQSEIKKTSSEPKSDLEIGEIKVISEKKSIEQKPPVVENKIENKSKNIENEELKINKPPKKNEKSLPQKSTAEITMNDIEKHLGPRSEYKLPDIDENIPENIIPNLSNPFSNSSVSDIPNPSEPHLSICPTDDNEENSPGIVAPSIKYKDYLEKKERYRITISKTETQGNFVNSYTVYFIETKSIDAYEPDGKAERRFSDFEWLHNYLLSKPSYKGLMIPELPEKKKMGNLDPSFVQSRKLELIRYLKDISRHPKLSEEKIFKAFIGMGDTNFNTLKENYPHSSFKLTELNMTKIMGIWEHGVANIWTKLKPSENSMSQVFEAKMKPIIELDQECEKTIKNLEKRMEGFEKTKKAAGEISTVYSRVSGFEQLKVLPYFMSVPYSNIVAESRITDDMLKDFKLFQQKLLSFKHAHAVFIATLQEIDATSEVLRTKDSKITGYRMENASPESLRQERERVQKELDGLKIDLDLIRNNLEEEMRIIMDEAYNYFAERINF